MAATLNLRFDAFAGQPTAQIGLSTTNGGLTEHDPLLSSPCEDFATFAEEIRLLHKELDRVEVEAKRRFELTAKRKKTA